MVRPGEDEKTSNARSGAKAQRGAKTTQRSAKKAQRSPKSRGGSRGSEPAPTLVLLVRHGQTPTTGAVLPGRAKGLHLGDAGREQAARAGSRIAALEGTRQITAVYASPMERAQQTAAPIARACGLRVRTHKGLNEADFGSWTGRKLADLRKTTEWKTVQRNPSAFRFPRGESFPEMQARMVAAIGDLVDRHRGEAIVAVSHADTIKAAVASAMGTHLDLFQRIVISPCSISAITYTVEGPVVLAVNSTGDDLSALVPS
jgi:probable phosphoglycerate mutase